MIYDFEFLNTSEDSAFFLYLIQSNSHFCFDSRDIAMQIFFFTHEQITHCLIPDYAALLKSYLEVCKKQNEVVNKYFDMHSAQDSSCITHFATLLSQDLPLSLHFRFKQITPLAPKDTFYTILNNLDSLPAFEMLLPYALDLHSSSISIAPLAQLALPTQRSYYYSAQETKLIVTPMSEEFAKLNAAGAAHKPLNLPDENFFNDIIYKLESGQNVIFDTQRGTQSLSLAPTTDSTAVLCDISSLKTYFRCHNAQINTLASFEKPLTYLVPKDVFASLFPLNVCGLMRVCLPYDMPLALLAILLLQKEIYYFFLTPTSIKPYFVFCHDISHRTQILNISTDGTLLDISLANGIDFPTLLHTYIPQCLPKTNALKPIHNSNNRHLAIYLSTRHESAFWVIEGEKHRILLDIEFEINPLLIIQDIAASYEGGSELIKNFSHKEKALFKRISTLDNQSVRSRNLSDLFSIAAFILGFTDEFATLQAKYKLFSRANAFVRERGPRIDYTLIREEKSIRLDYNRVIRSLLSFKCAGVEDEILSYGVIDSLCEFIATLVRDSVLNLAIDRVILLGDMLASHIVLDRILGYLPKDINLVLPKDGMLDY